MLPNCSWKERYLLSLCEEMNANMIMKLRNVNRKEALRIRKEAMSYCEKERIRVNGQKVPTEAVLKVTGKDYNYYYQKMVLEAKAKEN